MTNPAALRAQAAALEARAVELESPISRDELATMTEDAIVQAKADGRLDAILGITTTQGE